MTITVSRLQGRATAADIAPLAEAMFKESVFAPLGFSAAKVEKLAQDVLTGEAWIAHGVFDGEGLVGMCVGMCGEILPHTEAIVATQHYLYLIPEYRGIALAVQLIDAFTFVAKSRGAKLIVFSNGTGVATEKVGSLFESCGLTKVGGIYVLEV